MNIITSIINLYDTIFPYAKYKGDLLQIQKKLKETLENSKPIEVVDSALVLKGVVNKLGRLENVQLAFGQQSHFSDNMIKHTMNRWVKYLGKLNAAFRLAFFQNPLD